MSNFKTRIKLIEKIYIFTPSTCSCSCANASIGVCANSLWLAARWVKKYVFSKQCGVFWRLSTFIKLATFFFSNIASFGNGTCLHAFLFAEKIYTTLMFVQQTWSYKWQAVGRASHKDWKQRWTAGLAPSKGKRKWSYTSTYEHYISFVRLYNKFRFFRGYMPNCFLPGFHNFLQHTRQPHCDC